MKKKRYSWYIRPLDVHTNNIIANQLPPENFFDGALCADGKHHPLWKCEFSNIIDFQRSKKLTFCSERRKKIKQKPLAKIISGLRNGRENLFHFF